MVITNPALPNFRMPARFGPGQPSPAMAVGFELPKKAFELYHVIAIATAIRLGHARPAQGQFEITGKITGRKCPPLASAAKNPFARFELAGTLLEDAGIIGDIRLVGVHHQRQRGAHCQGGRRAGQPVTVDGSAHRYDAICLSLV